MSTALIVVDGVMRKLVGGAPIPEGMRLYRSLAATGRVVLLLNVPASGPDPTLDWLELNGCVSHDYVDYAADQTHLYVANRMRREGHEIDMVVEPDPSMARILIESGYNTLLFTHSAYAHPSWRPDSAKGVRPWGEIVDVTARLAKMKANDHRLRADE